MDKVNRCKLEDLYNDQIIEMMTETKALTEEHGATQLGIVAEFANFTTTLDNTKEAMKFMEESIFTPQIKE